MLALNRPEPAPQSGCDAALDNWIREIAAGEQAALAALYEACHGAVYGFALSILKNVQDAEDVLQDVFVQIWNGAGSYAARGKPMAWIFTITRNLALMRLRQASRLGPLPEHWHETAAASESVTAEDRMVLAALVEQLSDTERQIVTLHATAGFKHREIAALLDLPLPTVLSKYNRALKKLRTALDVPHVKEVET